MNTHNKQKNDQSPAKGENSLKYIVTILLLIGIPLTTIYMVLPELVNLFDTFVRRVGGE